MSEPVKIYAADVDGQNIEYCHVQVDEDAVVPAHVLVSIWEEEYAGLYLTPAAARSLAVALNDYANKVEY